MVSITEFRTDTRAINDGTWIRVHEGAYGNLEILSRGFTDEFIDAQTARVAKAAELYGGNKERIPNSQLRSINASLMEDYVVLDVRNLTDEKGEPVSVKDFHSMLYQPGYGRLARACWEAAAAVSNRSQAQMEAAVGNSSTRSGPTLNGAPSESA